MPKLAIFHSKSHRYILTKFSQGFGNVLKFITIFFKFSTLLGGPFRPQKPKKKGLSGPDNPFCVF